MNDLYFRHQKLCRFYYIQRANFLHQVDPELITEWERGHGKQKERKLSQSPKTSFSQLTRALEAVRLFNLGRCIHPHSTWYFISSMSEWTTAEKPNGKAGREILSWVCVVSAYGCVGVLRQFFQSKARLQVKVGGWSLVFNLNSALDWRAKWPCKASGRPADMIARMHTVCKIIKVYLLTSLTPNYFPESLSFWTFLRLHERSFNHLKKNSCH